MRARARKVNRTFFQQKTNNYGLMRLLIAERSLKYNVCFKKTGTKRRSNTLLRFVPVLLKQTLQYELMKNNSFEYRIKFLILKDDIIERKTTKHL